MEANGDLGNAMGAAPGRDGVGALLRARRLELGMSHADVAVLVKLPARRIAAAEEERWDELPEGPYLRGFLRNVARALQLDASSLMDRVDETRVRTRNPDSILVAPGATHAMLPRRSGPMDGRHNGRAFIYGAFLFALIAALIAWSGTASFDHVVDGGRALIAARSSGGDGKRAADADAVATAALPGAEVSVAADGPLPSTVASAFAGPAPAADAGHATVPVQAISTDSPQPPAADVALSFHFNEDSWVEVRAADGKVLLKQLNVAGSDQQLGGEAPFTLTVGNAKGVALTLRGKPVDLVPYTRGAVARLTLS